MQADCAMRDVIDIIVIGSACSGKTVLTHQLRCAYGKDDGVLRGVLFSDEKMSAVGALGLLCALNAVHVMLRAVRAAGTLLPPIRNPAAAQVIEAYFDVTKRNRHVTPEIIAALQMLWRGEPSFERLWDQRALLMLPSNAAYFMHHIARFSAPDFIPTEEDALRCYTPSKGVVAADIELTVKRQAVSVRMLDVGSTGVSGTRSRHARISDIFRSARGVIYVLNLADYDVTTHHSNGSLSNLLETRLASFREFINSNTFPSAMITLILSHRDVFGEKLRTSPLNHRGNESTAPRFKSYKGATFFDALTFLQDMVKAATKESVKKRKIPPLNTYALDLIDTAEVAVAMQAVAEALLSWNFEVLKALDLSFTPVE